MADETGDMGWVRRTGDYLGIAIERGLRKGGPSDGHCFPRFVTHSETTNGNSVPAADAHARAANTDANADIWRADGLAVGLVHE